MKRWIAVVKFHSEQFAVLALDAWCVLDNRVIDVWQKIFADPFQVRGVSLIVQVRSLYIITSVLCLFEPHPSPF